MQGVRLRRWSAGVLAATVTCVGLQAVTPSRASAECRPGDPNCSVDTGPNGGSVHVQFSGSGVSSVDGTSASVPPDCWFQNGIALEPALGQRILIEWFLGFLQLPIHPLSDYQAALEAHPNEPGSDYDEWKWYFLKCRPGLGIDSNEALSVAERTEWFGRQVARIDLLLQDGQETPSGVSVSTLLEVAQDAFTIPEPEVQQSPEVTDEGGATLVNLDTWFWSDDALESYTITATAGPVSVTLTAENTGYTLTSPFGSEECTYEQFKTKWTPELNGNPDAGCTLAFDQASNGDGHEVTVSSTWAVTWTATGINGTNTLDPITPSSTITVPVVEQWGDVTDVH